MRRTASPSGPITDVPAYLLWLSWSMYCYGYGVADTQRRALWVGAIGVVVGFMAGLAL